MPSDILTEIIPWTEEPAGLHDFRPLCAPAGLFNLLVKMHEKEFPYIPNSSISSHLKGLLL